MLDETMYQDDLDEFFKSLGESKTHPRGFIQIEHASEIHPERKYVVLNRSYTRSNTEFTVLEINKFDIVKNGVSVTSGSLFRGKYHPSSGSKLHPAIKIPNSGSLGESITEFIIAPEVFRDRIYQKLEGAGF